MAKRSTVAEEVAKIRQEIKAEINREIARDLKLLRDQIVQDVLVETKVYIDEKLAALPTGGGGGVNLEALKKELVKEVDRKVASANTQLVAVNNQQLIVAKQAMKDSIRELVPVIKKEVGKEVYAVVISEVNEKIVPQVNNMMEWVNFQTQDTGELITQYRRAVHKVAEGENSGKAITYEGKSGGGGKKKTDLGANVSLFFENDD